MSERSDEKMAGIAAAKNITSKFAVVYVTVPSLDVGKQIARSIVERKLAACVNIAPQVTSIYEWKGKIEEDQESLMIIKTKQSALEQLKNAVLKIHPYDVPEFISLPIEYGSEPYLNWLDANVNPTTSEKESGESQTSSTQTNC